MAKRVVKINARRGMVAVETDKGFSIFELTGGDNVEVGDEVSWQDPIVLGDATLVNYTQGTKYQVFFQNHHVTKAQLDGQLHQSFFSGCSSFHSTC